MIHADVSLRGGGGCWHAERGLPVKPGKQAQDGA